MTQYRAVCRHHNYYGNWWNKVKFAEMGKNDHDEQCYPNCPHVKVEER